MILPLQYINLPPNNSNHMISPPKRHYSSSNTASIITESNQNNNNLTAANGSTTYFSISGAQWTKSWFQNLKDGFLMSSMKVIRRPQGCGRLTISRSSKTLHRTRGTVSATPTSWDEQRLLYTTLTESCDDSWLQAQRQQVTWSTSSQTVTCALPEAEDNKTLQDSEMTEDPSSNSWASGDSLSTPSSPQLVYHGLLCVRDKLVGSIRSCMVSQKMHSHSRTRPQQSTNSKAESSILVLTWWSVPAQPLCAPERRGRAGSSWSSACGCWDTAAGWRWLSGTGNDLHNTRLQTGWQLAQPNVLVTLGWQGRGQHIAHLRSILNSYDPASTKKPFTTLSQTPFDAAAWADSVWASRAGLYKTATADHLASFMWNNPLQIKKITLFLSAWSNRDPFPVNISWWSKILSSFFATVLRTDPPFQENASELLTVLLGSFSFLSLHTLWHTHTSTKTVAGVFCCTIWTSDRQDCYTRSECRGLTARFGSELLHTCTTVLNSTWGVLLSKTNEQQDSCTHS